MQHMGGGSQRRPSLSAMPRMVHDMGCTRHRAVHANMSCGMHVLISSNRTLIPAPHHPMCTV